MSSKICPDRNCKTASEVKMAAVDFINELDSGELLTGTPTVAEVTTSDLTLANKAVNTAALTINGKAVAIGQAVQFSIAGGAAGTSYKITVSCGTDATVAQTLYQNVMLDVIADTG